jgi:sugar phosphate permease
VAGYLVYYLTRGSFTFVAPVLRADMGWGLKEVGRVTSLFPLFYGCSKFASGMAVDVFGSR